MSERPAEPAEHGSDEELDEEGRESFPASDPPSSWAGEDEPPRQT